MWRIAIRLVFAAFLAQTGNACSDAPDPTASPEVPIFEGSIELEIGEIDGDDPYLFTRIESIVEDASGRLIVADLQSHEVRIFGPEGDFLFHFGGQGEGPGELTDPCCLAFGPDSELWVRESTRYSAFRLEAASAQYASGLRIAHSGIGMVSPVSFDAEGRLVDIGPVNGPDGGTVMARLHRTPGDAVDTVLMADPDRQATGSTTVERMFGETPWIFFVYQPFGPRWIHAHAPGGAWAEAITSAYSINYHHPDGTVFRIEGPPLHGPGADGDQMRQADVYMGAELVARYRWPRRVRTGDVPWASESLLYGTTRDSLDVQRVARVRFRPVF